MNQSQFFLSSFLVIAFHYVLLFVSLVTGIGVISYLGFPEIYQLYAGDAAEFKQVWEKTPEKLWPAGFCIGIGIWGAVSSWLVGFQVGWFAPAAKLGHGVFLGLLCLISFLQLAITQRGIPVGLLLTMLIVYPLLIYAGASVSARR